MHCAHLFEDFAYGVLSGMMREILLKGLYTLYLVYHLLSCFRHE